MSHTNRTYLDNAATSFPKPRAVHDAMLRFATEVGASPGRGAYAQARDAGHMLYECRRRLCTLFNGENPDHVIFTLNATDALNMAIHGLIGGGGHLITTWMDHNSVLRPFNALTPRPGVEQSRVECDPATCLVDPDAIRKAIRPTTKIIAVTHGSNVTGTLQPIRQIGAIAREHDIPLLVDASQTLGHVPIDVQADHIDLLAFPGHKGLLGPLGTGGLYIRPGVEKHMHPYRQGGTGSASESDTQPDFMPDRFEPGSHNAVGVAGLTAAVGWVVERGVEELWRHERALCAQMIESLTSRDELPGLRLYGPQGVGDRCGVFSIRVDGFDRPQDLSDLLEREYGILTRSGLHCAPLAHQTIGTDRVGGTTRLSLGPFLTARDIQYVTDALAQVCCVRAG